MRRRDLLGAVALSAALRAQSPNAARCRLRTGVVAYSYRKQLEAKSRTYEWLIAYASELGLDGVDLTVYWLPETSDSYLASLRRVAFKNAVDIFGIAVRVRLSQPTPALQQAEFETAKKWVDVAEKLGASHIRIFGGPIPKGATEEQAIQWAVEVLKRCADYSGSKGIILGLEDDGGLTTNAEPTVEIVKRAASPWAGINLDTGNFPKNGYSQVAMCIPYTTSVHIKSQIANESGQKVPADWDRLAGMLAKAGYKGYLSIEHEETDVESSMPKLAAELRRVAAKYNGV